MGLEWSHGKEGKRKGWDYSGIMERRVGKGGRDRVRVESWKKEREGGRKGVELEWNHGKKGGRDGVSVES